MTRLQLTLLGSPVILVDGVPFNSRVDKAVALVALLALQGPTLHRDTLIAHLWTGSESSKTRAAFRTAIWRLKETVLSPWLDIERDHVTLRTDHSLWIDIEEFQDSLEKPKSHTHSPDIVCPGCIPLLNRAIELYRGDFMAGYSPRNATGFDDWRSEFGNILRGQYLFTLERLAKGHYQHANYGQALQVARRWLAIDQFNEEAHSLMMRGYASSNQRANAVAHYRAYKRLVEKKLNIAPAEEITALYNRLLSGKNQPQSINVPLRQPALILLDLHDVPELWARHGSAIEQIMARFTNIVKDVLQRCGGRIIKQTGESFAIYFDHGQPLMCAIAIQRQISETRWDQLDRLSVRMVITSIPKNQTSYPENSPELISCQQLLQSASANQILITEQAVGTLEFPISSQTRDLGSYLIPGQLNPVQVYELVHPQLPSYEHTGLQNLVRSPFNLPIQSTRFIGRESELKTIAHLLAQPESRLLTLVGPGGVVTTRLAIEAINQLLGTQTHGIYYVPLAAHRNPSTLYSPIADALNLSFNNPGDQISHLIDHIKHRRMLLLLDNFEHLLPAAHFLIDLLEGAPGLRLLITSRERMNLQMETIFEVQGLPYPLHPDEPDFEQYSAVQLFTQSARRVSPRFTLHPEDKKPLIRICSQVEGLPLGIELSSAWVRAFSCQEIADSIQKNLDFLYTNSSDVPERHRSLRAAFNHSWILLSEEARRTIGKLAVFRDGFSLPAAEHVAHATPNMLASYVDKSIITKQSNGRFLMPETLRAYVIELIKSDPVEYGNLLDIHSEYILNYLINMLPEFASEHGGTAIKEIQLDAGNIRAAIGRAMDCHHWPTISRSIDPLMTYFELQGRFRDGLEIAREMLVRLNELVGMQQPHLYYHLLGWDGWFSFCLGFTQDGLDKLHKRLENTQSQGDVTASAFTLMLLADAHSRLGDQDTALREIEHCLEITNKVWTPAIPYLIGVRGYALTIYGSILLKLKRIEAARQALNLSSEAVIESGGRYGLIRLLDVKARIAIDEEKYEQSRAMRLQALEIATEFNDRRNIAKIMNNIGESLEHLGDYPASLSYAHRAELISDEIGDRQLSAVSNNNLGYITLQLNYPPADAIYYYEKSLAVFRQLGNIYGIFFTLRDIARACLLSQSIMTARSYLVEAIHVGINLKEPLLGLHLLTVVARLKVHLGQSAQAVQLCSIVLQHPHAEADLKKEAKSLLQELDSPLGTSTGWQAAPSDVALPTFEALLAEVEW
jgi:predicted ATPase/DNA-binding SARP family transcriptional activator